MKNVRRDDWESLAPTVYGWGINDVNYRVKLKEELPRVNGQRKRKVIWDCPYYHDWREMLRRGFSDKFKKRQPAYKDCTVCEEWKYLSNFIKWVDSQPNRDWLNCDLDKDFLSSGNKYYSPKTCVYITSSINRFILTRSKGTLLIGVQPSTAKGVFKATIMNPFVSKEKTHIGTFATELEAHKAWQAKKHEYACRLAETQSDERVIKFLMERYSPDKDWTKV